MQAVRFARVGTSPEKVPGRGTGPIGIYPIFQGHPGARSPVFGIPARTHLRQLSVGVERTGCRFSPGGEAQNSPGLKHLGYSVFPPSGECGPPAYLNAYGQLPDIESRLKRPRQLKPMRMAMKNWVYAYGLSACIRCVRCIRECDE